MGAFRLCFIRKCMKVKGFFFFVACGLVAGCKLQKAATSGQAESTNLEKFVTEINLSIQNQDYDQFLNLVDSDYKSIQLKAVGDTAQFVSELFCGQFETKYYCPPFSEIKAVMLNADNKTFLIILNSGISYKSNSVEIVLKDNKYYLIGAYG